MGYDPMKEGLDRHLTGNYGEDEQRRTRKKSGRRVDKNLASRTITLKYEAGPLIPLYEKYYGEDPADKYDLIAFLRGLLDGDLETIRGELEEDFRQKALEVDD